MSSWRSVRLLTPGRRCKQRVSSEPRLADGTNIIVDCSTPSASVIEAFISLGGCAKGAAQITYRQNHKNLFPCRQFDRDDQARAGFGVFGPNFPAVGMHGPLRDSEPEPDTAALAFARFLGPVKRAEEIL